MKVQKSEMNMLSLTPYV